MIGGEVRTPKAMESFIGYPKVLAYGASRVILVYIMPNMFTSS